VVGVDDEGRVRQIADRIEYDGPPLAPHVFTGVHIMEPELLDYIPPDIESCINAYAYPKVIKADRVVAAHVYDGFWADVGTLERYWQVNSDFLRRRVQLQSFDLLAEIGNAPRKDVDDVIRLGDKCTLGAGVRLEPPVIVADGARIADGAEVGPEVVVGSNASIGKGARVMRAILLDGAKVEASAEIRDEVVTRKGRIPLHSEG
jgi:mannose-1-phosphate guanylyltransferase